MSADLQAVLQQIDDLTPDQLEQVYRHVVQRRRADYWLIPGEHLRPIAEIMQPVREQAASMSDDEINAAIDDALDEVRRERSEKTNHSD